MGAALCRSFDAAGDGYGRSEGFAAIILVPTSNLSPDSRVYAFVHGSAVNQVKLHTDTLAGTKPVL